MDRELLVEEFEDMGLTIAADMIDECAIECVSNKVSPSDLVGSWIAYCASHQIDANDLTKERLNTLIKSLKNDKNKANDKKESLNSNQLEIVSSPAPSASTSEMRMIDLDNFKIFEADDENIENTSSSGDVACEFGQGNINTTNPSADVKICLLNQNLWDKFAYGRMSHQKYDNHIQKLVEDIKKKNNLKLITPFSNLCIGNNSEEIAISGCLQFRQKQLFLCFKDDRIKLDLTEAIQPINQLFANQIVVVTGTYPANKVFQVRKLFTEAPLQVSKKLPNFQGNLNMIVATGPFFSDVSPHGKQLKSLVQKTIEFEANLLILLGPILDTDFGYQLNRRTMASFQNCYDDILESVLKPLFSNPSTQNTKVLILSSWKDVGPFGFYPTPPNPESRLPDVYPNKVFFVSDPCLFSVNDVIIAANASDSLMGLHVSAISQKKGEEMLAKLAKQIIGQQCLHPSYMNNPSVPIDQELWLEHCSLQNIPPHVILMTSQLRTFAMKIEDSLVVNVGQLVKHNFQKQVVPGTYGKIQLSPAENGTWSSETNISAKIIYL